MQTICHAVLKDWPAEICMLNCEFAHQCFEKCYLKISPIIRFHYMAVQCHSNSNTPKQVISTLSAMSWC